jgi:ribosomal 50S subunit-recycling heat shock protein
LERQRLDKWLWHARVVKARTSAAALVEAGHVRINGVREKAPGHSVKVGDVLTIALDRTVRVSRWPDFPSGAAMPRRRACSTMICRIAKSD